MVLKRRKAALFQLRFIATTHMHGRHLSAHPHFSAIFRKLVLSLPYPPEPRKEVEKNVRLLFRGQDPKYVTEAYLGSAMHPPDRVAGQPVKLSDLCRIVVRQQLRKNFQLPQGVDALNIPTVFKKFLNFEDNPFDKIPPGVADLIR